MSTTIAALRERFRDCLLGLAVGAARRRSGRRLIQQALFLIRVAQQGSTMAA
jgi:hypothetical protein